VVADLAVLGARRIVRVGTAVAQDLPPGEIVVAESVSGHDGTSRALGGGEPDPALTTALADAGARRAALVSVDVLGNPAAQLADLQSAAVLAAAARAGLAAASLVAVVEHLGIPPSAETEQTLGRIALAALG